MAAYKRSDPKKLAQDRHEIARQMAGAPSAEEEALQEDFTPFTLMPTFRAASGFLKTVGLRGAALASEGARSFGKMMGAASAQGIDQGTSPAGKLVRRARKKK